MKEKPDIEHSEGVLDEIILTQVEREEGLTDDQVKNLVRLIARIDASLSITEKEKILGAALKYYKKQEGARTIN